MRVITVISISPIWKSIESYHLENIVWPMRCAVLSEHLPNLHISLHIPRANENGTCINLELAEMRVITVISISPIWKSIKSYHLGNIVWPMRCAVLSEHLPNLHISLHIPRANENGTCINLELAEMRVITVISISPIWKSIESYHLGNIVWPMICAVLSEHLPNLHISLHIPRANENGTCINLELAEMRVITVISISPIWKSIESYHFGKYCVTHEMCSFIRTFT